MCAAPTPQPARLWLKPAQGGREAVWTIKDGGRRISTGCGKRDSKAAEAALALYLDAKRRARESGCYQLSAAELEIIKSPEKARIKFALLAARETIRRLGEPSPPAGPKARVIQLRNRTARA